MHICKIDGTGRDGTGVEMMKQRKRVELLFALSNLYFCFSGIWFRLQFHQVCCTLLICKININAKKD